MPSSLDRRNQAGSRLDSFAPQLSRAYLVGHGATLHRHRDHRPRLVSSFSVQQEHPEACGVSSPDVEDTSISVHYQSILSVSSKRGG